jgi:hypothetical protein
MMQCFNYALAVIAQHCTSCTKIASANVHDVIVTRHSGGLQASSFVLTSRVASHTSLSESKEHYPRVDVSSAASSSTVTFHFSSSILGTTQQCEVSMKPPTLIGDHKVIQKITKSAISDVSEVRMCCNY